MMKSKQEVIADKDKYCTYCKHFLHFYSPCDVCVGEVKHPILPHPEFLIPEVANKNYNCKHYLFNDYVFCERCGIHIGTSSLSPRLCSTCWNDTMITSTKTKQKKKFGLFNDIMKFIGGD